MDKLPVGSGHLDLTAYLRGDEDILRGGVQADYEHRVKKNLSVFGRAHFGSVFAFGKGYDLDYGALGGLRWNF